MTNSILFRAVTFLLAVFGFALGGIVFISVATLPDENACLHFKSHLLDRGMISLQSGSPHLFGKPLQTLDLGNLPNISYSPNDKYLIYFHLPQDYLTQGRQVMLKAADMPSQNAVLLEDHLDLRSSTERDYTWSSDGHWLAYQWKSIDGSHYLSIVDAEGHNKRIVPISAQADEVVNLYGWSGDDTYLALSIEPRPGDKAAFSTRGVTVHFFTASDLKLVRTLTVTNTFPGRGLAGSDGPGYWFDNIRWGKADAWLALMVVNTDQTVGLRLLSPDATRDLQFTIPYLHSPTSYGETNIEYSWAPDGQHVALFSLPDLEYIGQIPRRRLDIFGTDGTAFYDVTEQLASSMIIAGGGLGSPLAFWSNDGQTLFFVRDFTSPHSTLYRPERGDLYAWRSGDVSPLLVQPNIYLNPSMTRDQKYMIVEWSEDGTRYIAGFDPHTLSRTFLVEAKSKGIWKQAKAIALADSQQLIVYEDELPIATVNLVTGATADLPAIYWQDRNFANEPQMSDDLRYVGVQSPDNSHFWLTDVADGATDDIWLDHPSPDELQDFIISPDVKLIAFVYDSRQIR